MNDMRCKLQVASCKLQVRANEKYRLAYSPSEVRASVGAASCAYNCCDMYTKQGVYRVYLVRARFADHSERFSRCKTQRKQNITWVYACLKLPGGHRTSPATPTVSSDGGVEAGSCLGLHRMIYGTAVIISYCTPHIRRMCRDISTLCVYTLQSMVEQLPSTPKQSETCATETKS